MNQHEQKLRNLLHHADMETVEQIGTEFPAADDAAKERVMHGIMEQPHMTAADIVQEEDVPVIRHSRYRSICAAAVCLLICGGIVGSAALHGPMQTMGENRTASEATAAPEETEAVQQAAVVPETAEQAEETDAPLKIQPETTAAVPVETAIVTVIAEAPVQETQTEATAAEIVTTILQETAPVQTVTETSPAETQAAKSTVQNTFEFISMAENVPVVPGFKVTLSESELGPTCAIWPENAADGKSKIEAVYTPAYLPEGWALDTEQLAVMEQNYADIEETYIYEHWYYPPRNADGSYLLTDTFLLLTQKRLNADGVELPLVKDETACYLMREQKYVYGASGMTEPDDLYTHSYAVTEVNGHPAYIYRKYWENDPNVDNLHYMQYTLYWEQDGYLFSLYTADIPESYLPELIRTAESVQPIG